METDRNPLFAGPALQARLIDRGRSVQACTLCVAGKDIATRWHPMQRATGC